MKRLLALLFCFSVALVLMISSKLNAADFLGPTAYLKFDDNSPFRHIAFDYFHFEDFEDGYLNTPGVTSSTGEVIKPGLNSDSVDEDDGDIDGSGSYRRSWYSRGQLSVMTFVFHKDVLGSFPTHAGIVWTDVGYAEPEDGYGNVTFEVFDADGLSLGTIGPVALGDGKWSGETEEDRFFGAIEPSGISKLEISMDNSVDWEVDHLQYGFVVTGCGGQEAWNIRVNAEDFFESNEAWVKPWRGSSDDGWGKFEGGYAYEFQWHHGPYNQPSGSVGDLNWSVDSNGKLTVGASSPDNQWHAWTYVYLTTAKDLYIDAIRGGSVPRVFVNHDFDTPQEFPATLHLTAGWNRIDITGYNQNDSQSFDLNYPLACHVDEMDSDPTECHCADTDGDGVPDAWDQCPDTPQGSAVFSNGCRPTCTADFDGDGDVDGSDLAVFAADFGRTDCPLPE